MSRTRRSFWSLLTGLFGSVCLMVMGLLSTPLRRRWLGDEKLGAYPPAPDLAGYLGLLQFGLGGAVQSMQAGAIGRDDRSEVASITVAGIRGHLVSMCLMLVAGAALAFALPSFISLPPASARDLRFGFIVGLGITALVPLVPF